MDFINDLFEELKAQFVNFLPIIIKLCVLVFLSYIAAALISVDTFTFFWISR